MKKVIVIVAAIIMIAGFSSSVFAQVGSTLSTAGSANLITPLELTQVSPLHFGTLAAGATAGTVNLTVAGVRTSTGGVNLSASAPTLLVASYTITGQASTSYAVTIPATFTVANGTPTMVVTPVTDGATGTLSGTGTGALKIAGSLAVGAAQAPGVYTGNFNVTIAYN